MKYIPDLGENGAAKRAEMTLERDHLRFSGAPGGRTF